jgi:hypothetical protein
VILDDMLTLIAGSGLGLTAGTNLFAGTWPDSPDKACAVYETGGGQPVHAMGAGPGNALVELPRIAVWTRANSYQSARQLAHNVFQSMDGLTDTTINSTRYLLVSAVNPPTANGFDDSGRRILIMNFDVIKKLSTSTST